MSGPVVTVRDDSPLADVVATMEKHQIRRVPVVDERDSCVGIISQADVSWSGGTSEVAKLVRDISRKSE
jgi:CBS domain-containing protein